MSTTPLQDEFDEMVKQVWPDGIPDNMRYDLTRVWYAGAMVTFMKVTKASSLPEGEAIEALQDLRAELHAAAAILADEEK